MGRHAWRGAIFVSDLKNQTGTTGYEKKSGDNPRN
jgi:hypothetical protein